MNSLHRIAIRSFAVLLAALLFVPSAQAFSVNMHFDNYSRCVNERRTVDERIIHCKRIIGGGVTREETRDVLTTLAYLYRVKRDYTDALAAINEALDQEIADSHIAGIYSPRIEMLGERATIYAETGSFEQAAADAEESARIAPDYSGTYNLRGWVRAVAGRELEQAVADSNKALMQRADESNYLYTRGLVNFKLGNLQSALADFDAAIQHYSDDAESLYARGIVKQHQGNSEEGKADMEKALSRRPGVADEAAGYGLTP